MRGTQTTRGSPRPRLPNLLLQDVVVFENTNNTDEQVEVLVSDLGSMELSKLISRRADRRE